MGDKIETMKALDAFFGLTLDKKNYPECQWSLIEKKGKIKFNVHCSPDQLMKAKLWLSSSKTRDFRQSKWISNDLNINNKTFISTTIKYPSKDYLAFYIDLVYQNPKGGDYSVSTRTYVMDKKQVFIK